MGIMVDFREISEGELKTLRNTARDKLLDLVSFKSKKPRAELVVRDILPKTDLGLTHEEWANKTTIVDSLSAEAWTMDWSHELDEDEGVVFYGVHVHDTGSSFHLMFMRFKLGATGSTVKDLVNLQRIDNKIAEDNKGYFNPVYYGGKDTIYIDYYARAQLTAGDCHIELLGMFCEPRGEVIS